RSSLSECLNLPESLIRSLSSLSRLDDVSQTMTKRSKTELPTPKTPATPGLKMPDRTAVTIA
ncbi:hypothetical protein OFC10_34195, partial [Escherichia coli]|nr:hypothetical protein [Escherichia coli]